VGSRSGAGTEGDGFAGARAGDEVGGIR